MTDMKHTPEPWDYEVIGSNGEVTIYPILDNEWCIAICTDGVMAERSGGPNASRIVTCVNACAGMPDPAAEIAALRAEIERKDARIRELESEVAHGVLDATNRMVDARADAMKERDKWRAMAKARLCAIRTARDYYIDSAFGFGGYAKTVMEILSAAIEEK